MRLREIQEITWCWDDDSGNFAICLKGILTEDNYDQYSWEQRWLFPPKAGIDTLDALCDMIVSDEEYFFSDKVNTDEIGRLVGIYIATMQDEFPGTPTDAKTYKSQVWRTMVAFVAQHLPDPIEATDKDAEIFETVNIAGGPVFNTMPSWTGYSNEKQRRFFENAIEKAALKCHPLHKAIMDSKVNPKPLPPMTTLENLLQDYSKSYFQARVGVA